MQVIDGSRLAYVVGVAIGDGNLSNSNNRAVRLRVTCDTKYPNLIDEIIENIKSIMPNNKVSLVPRKNCVDVSCYSNQWEELLGWKAKGGPKHTQNVGIPAWIKNDTQYSTKCLKGLFQTDGCLYIDRGYKMINFVSIIPQLVKDVEGMIIKLGFEPKTYSVNKNQKIKNTKYTLRVSKDVEKFINTIGFSKN